jgi:deoxyribonuclease IV
MLRMSRFAYDGCGDLLGAHVSTKGGPPTIFARGEAIGARALALFSKNSNQWKARPLDDDVCARFASERERTGIRPLFAHTSYLINLATTNPEFLEKSVVAMIDELTRAEMLSLPAIVLHPGAHMGSGSEAGIDSIARGLDQVHASLPENGVVTLLETSAGQGSCVGSTFEELGAIMSRVDDPSRLGICFDTCHVFAAGYDITSRDGWERTIDELDAAAGIGNVGLFHLNDSKKGLGSRVDRHEHIGEGMLGLEPFRLLLNDERFRAIPKVLETPKPEVNPEPVDIRNLTVLRSLFES